MKEKSRGRNLLIRQNFIDLLGLEKEAKRNYVLQKGHPTRVGTLGEDKQVFQLKATIQNKTILAHQQQKSTHMQIQFQIFDHSLSGVETRGIYSIQKEKSCKQALSMVTFHDGAFASEIRMNEQMFGENELFFLQTPHQKIYITEEGSSHHYEKGANHTKVIHIHHEMHEQPVLHTKYSYETRFAVFDWENKDTIKYYDEKDMDFLYRYLHEYDASYYQSLKDQIRLFWIGEENLFINGVAKCFAKRGEDFQKVLLNCYK